MAKLGAATPAAGGTYVFPREGFGLLGGAARTCIPVSWSTGSSWRMEPPEILDRVKSGWDLGFRALKIRMAWRQDINPDKDFEMFRLVLDSLVPEICLALDANNGYSVSTAIQQGRRFEALGINHFEEPIPNYDLPGLKQVADALDIAVSAGEQDAFRWWFHQLVLLGDPDILQPDILDAGGVSEVKRIYDMATTLDKPVMPHSPHAGINSMASPHVYSTAETSRPPASRELRTPSLRSRRPSPSVFHQKLRLFLFEMSLPVSAKS